MKKYKKYIYIYIILYIYIYKYLCKKINSKNFFPIKFSIIIPIFFILFLLILIKICKNRSFLLNLIDQKFLLSRQIENFRIRNKSFRLRFIRWLNFSIKKFIPIKIIKPRIGLECCIRRAQSELR